ncbi:MAG: hypothetical protein K2N72_05015 [Oscillospiraceae bacterium]|nr:hypothetical protein [Oscillospiraceae bacterium]
MSVGLYRLDPNIQGYNFVYYQPVCGEAFYREHWQRAVAETHSRFFQDQSKFSVKDVPVVLDELRRQKEWAYNNLSGRKLIYMVSSIENLEENLPIACEENDLDFELF